MVLSLSLVPTPTKEAPRKQKKKLLAVPLHHPLPCVAFSFHRPPPPHAAIGGLPWPLPRPRGPPRKKKRTVGGPLYRPLSLHRPHPPSPPEDDDWGDFVVPHSNICLSQRDPHRKKKSLLYSLPWSPLLGTTPTAALSSYPIPAHDATAGFSMAIVPGPDSTAEFSTAIVPTIDATVGSSTAMLR